MVLTELVGPIGFTRFLCPWCQTRCQIRSVGKISDKNYSVSTIVPREAVDAIDKRRAGQSMTRSKYVSLIVSKWLADGCPAVNEADRAIRALNGPAGKSLRKTA